VKGISFTLSKTSIPGIATGSATDTFTVAPNTALATGTYTATVSITGGNSITAEFSVIFTVNKAAGAAVSAPTVSSTTPQTSSTITVNAATAPSNGQTVEYDVSTANNSNSATGWQTSTIFNGLTASTTYYVYARSASNANYNAGTPSVSAGIKTAPGVYALGSTGPGGGIIFYYSAAGFTMTDTNEVCHYLEAAPNNMLTSLTWASSSFTSTDIGGTSDAIGTGRKNTALILAIDADAPAAKACKDLTTGGKTDWFLPSYYELFEIYNRKFYFTDISNDINSYITSTQRTLSFAWIMSYFSGSFSSGSKGTGYSVRAVRAF